MKAATEEVNKTLENAGQNVSLEGKPICLNQMQLNDMPVLGMLNLLRYISFTTSRTRNRQYTSRTCLF